MHSLLRLFKRPYGTHHSVRLRLYTALGFGAFVFLFLWFFRPFGMESLAPNERLGLSAGFGAITTGSMLLLNVLLPRALAGFFKESQWTTGREIFWTTLNLSFIGLMNAWFFTHWQGRTLNLNFVLWFQGVTWGLGILPVTFYVLYHENKYRRKFQAELDQWPSGWSRKVPSPNAPRLQFPSHNQQEALALNQDQFLYAQAEDNYVAVYYREGGKTHSTLLRSSLKKLEMAFADHPSLFRCHKSYMVNLAQVERLSGNAQGYRLHLKNGVEPSLPVSRKLNQSIKERLTVHP